MSDRVYVGIDLASAKMGLVLLNERQVLLHASRMVMMGAKVPDKWERYGRHVNLLLEVLTPYRDQIDAVYIEGYGGNFKNSLIPAVECGTLARQALFHLGLRAVTREIPPLSLKAFTIGNGNAKKEHMIAEVYRKYNWMAPDEDQADAYALATMAVKASVPKEERQEKLLNYELKALDKLAL